MRHLLAVLLCLLLCGCAWQPPPPETAPVESTTPVKISLYDPDHPMEKAHPGLVRAYPLTDQNVHGILPLKKDVLVLSGQENTTMTLFTGEELSEKASLTLDFSLGQEDPSLEIQKNNLSFYDPSQQQTVVLDSALREVRRIAAPEGLSGKPILSPDGDILYYCTGWAVMAWDLQSGIRRTVKELSYESQELTALHLDGSVLECTIRDNGTTSKLFLSADQGIEVGTLPGSALLNTGSSRYFTALPAGYQTLLVFGDVGNPPDLLLPEGIWQQQFYLPEDHAAVTVSASESGMLLNYYELNTGLLRSSLDLDTDQPPKSMMNSTDHGIYILAEDPTTGCDILYRWDVLRQKPESGNVISCKSAYPGTENPDAEALETCRAYAKAIGDKYGITIRIGEDAVAVQPWDYRFQPEILAPILQNELKLLDQRLAQYPQTVLQQTKDHFTGLTLCLVREIHGTEEDRSLSSATGIQFFQDKEAYVVITTGKYSEQALYHELYHVMETHILTESTALDRWETLNPAGFVYGEIQQDADIYLKGQTRAFADRYSMNALKEDRARILENALLPGKRKLFQSEYMQRKLSAMCTGIREAYCLKKYPETFPWEQYLVTPLVPEE